ncbi:MAG TPA: cyclic nucleotide-binding domain-containing protein [Pseudobdellovibrionaceae bacterium]|nr:cyclic nucleotide-binding domain-containing protein [Pseudobdellovibrionaceae bacterium]
MAENKKIPKDYYLFREGDAPDSMYIVKSGGFAITKTKGSSEIVLAEIKAGAMVGEMALFDLKPRSANVKALKDSEVISLPYDNLLSQLEALPVWVKAILRNLNENLREANKKIKILENTSADEDRFPPHVVNKLLSILNYVFLRFGKDDEKGKFLNSMTLRNQTIQVFQEPTNKMQSMVNSLTEMGYITTQDVGDGTQRILNHRPDDLFRFAEWYNEWLFKQEKDRLPSLKEEEVKTLKGLIHFAKKIEVDKKGFRKVNLNNVQNESVKELGGLLKIEDVNSLVEKKYLNDKVMDESGVSVFINLEELEPQANHWDIVNIFKRKLR